MVVELDNKADSRETTGEQGTFASVDKPFWWVKPAHSSIDSHLIRRTTGIIDIMTRERCYS